jgi:hypothetical protein
MKDTSHARLVLDLGADCQANTLSGVFGHMADTRIDRHNVLGLANPEEEVVSALGRIYLVECGAHTVGDKERRTMKHTVVVGESD